jgi:hypothetical protein
MSAEAQRTCPGCGSELSGTMEFCPVCMLRIGLAGAVESGDSSTEDILYPSAGDMLNSRTGGRGATF